MVIRVVFHGVEVADYCLIGLVGYSLENVSLYYFFLLVSLEVEG